MLENLNKIKLESPSDKIIRQIRNLVTSGQLNPGDKLPPERKLAEKLGVGRSHVRDAIRKLEFYGIVKTLPQSGTVISGLGIYALEGLLTDVLEMEEADFASLIETRVILEINGANRAATRRTEEDIEALQGALSAYEVKLMKGLNSVEEDLFFHIKIAEASQNSVLKSLMMIITPDIMKSFVRRNICNDVLPERLIKEHRDILQHIIDQNPNEAENAMKAHLKDVLEYSRSLNNF